VRLLLEKGANIEAQYGDGNYTALSGAAAKGHEAVVRLLLENGADINHNGWQPALHHAAGGGHEAVVRLLIEKGANVKAKNKNGETALHRATGASLRSEEMVRLLLEYGADIQAKDNEGATALQLAAGRKNWKIVRLLEKTLAASEESPKS